MGKAIQNSPNNQPTKRASRTSRKQPDKTTPTADVTNDEAQYSDEAIKFLTEHFDAFQRVPEYQELIRDFFPATLVDFENITQDVKQHAMQYPERSVERLAGMTWNIVATELTGILDDLYAEDDVMIYKRQRGYYATLRFCIESVADFVYMIQQPQELKKFFSSNEKIDQAVEEVHQRYHNSAEIDRQLAKLVQQGKLSGRISDRIVDFLPGCLPHYALCCLYTHSSMQGMALLQSAEALDLLYHKTARLAMELLPRLFVVIEHLGLTSEQSGKTFEGIYRKLTNLDRRIMNLYYGKHDKSLLIKKSDADELYQAFCARNSASDQSDNEPDKPSNAKS